MAAAAMLACALLPCAAERPQPVVTPAEAESFLEIGMSMDVSGISQASLAELIAGEGFDFTVRSAAGEQSFTLRGGESVRLPLSALGGDLTVEQYVSGAFIAAYGEPQSSAVLTLCAADAPAELFTEYTYRNVSGRVTTAESTEGGVGICSLQGKRQWAALSAPESGSVSLKFINTVDTPEYGNLRIDMHAPDSAGCFDVLVRLGSGGTALPAPAGTPYLFLGSAGVWTLRKIESAGVLSLRDGESAMFTMLCDGAAYSVRETKNSARGFAVVYGCDMLAAAGDYRAVISCDGSAATVSGVIVPDYAATRSVVPSATVTVTIKNTVPGGTAES